MKSYGVTIQMKPLQQIFNNCSIFNKYVVLTFESLELIPWYYHSNETSKKNGLSVRNIGNIRVFILCCFVITVYILSFSMSYYSVGSECSKY